MAGVRFGSFDQEDEEEEPAVPATRLAVSPVASPAVSPAVSPAASPKPVRQKLHFGSFDVPDKEPEVPALTAQETEEANVWGPEALGDDNHVDKEDASSTKSRRRW